MTGDFITADEALRIGLYNRVVPDGDALITATAFAGKLTIGPSRAIEITKQAIDREMTMDLEAALESEAQIQAALMTHADFREAYEAFVAEAGAEVSLMRIVCVGGGPGGLYFAGLMKKANPAITFAWSSAIVPDDTFGFGVVFSDATMAGIAEADSEAFRGIGRHLVHWDDIEVNYRGERITSTGHGFSGMSRHTLSTCSRSRPARRESRCCSSETSRASRRSPTPISSSPPTVRTAPFVTLLRDRIETAIDLRPNRFVWLWHDEAVSRLHLLLQAKRPRAVARARLSVTHRAARRSSWSAARRRWRAAGLQRASEEDTAAFLEDLFGEELDGHRLVTNRSIWRQFPTIRTAAVVRATASSCSATRRIPRTSPSAPAHEWRWKTPSPCAMRSPQSGDTAAALRAYEARRASAGREPAARGAGIAAMVRGHGTLHDARRRFSSRSRC